MSRFAVIFAVWMTLAAVAIGQASEADTQAAMLDLAKKHQAWNPKLNSPGVSIKLSEVRKSPPHLIYYTLTASGFPPDLKYEIVTWPANRLGPQTGMTGVTLNASGLAICAGAPGTCKGRAPNAPIEMQFGPVKSEPIRLALLSVDDKHLRAVVNFVPIPNRASDKNCSFEEIMLAPQSALVALQGSGFDPNSDVQFLSESEGEHHDGQVKADSEGNFFFAMGMGVKGKEKGVTKLSVISHTCAASLTVPWGKDSYQYE